MNNTIEGNTFTARDCIRIESEMRDRDTPLQLSVKKWERCLKLTTLRQLDGVDINRNCGFCYKHKVPTGCMGCPLFPKYCPRAGSVFHQLFDAINDCGAGGISSAITELAREHGVEVNLEKVPLKYRGLSYTEIWISESQERMVFFSPESNLEELRQIFEEEDVELSVVGKVTDNKKLVLYYEGNKVGELGMDFIFKLPRLDKKGVWIERIEKDHKLKEKDNYCLKYFSYFACVCYFFLLF